MTIEKTNSAILNYISQKILEDLRSGLKINNEVLSVILVGDYIQNLRKQIKPKDKILVIRLIKSRNILVKRLGISLSKAIASDRLIETLLIKTWRQNNESDLKFELMYRLLDNKNISEELVRSIYDYVIGNYGEWRKHVIEWGGGLNKIFKSITSKIESFPEHKRWVYLYELSWILEEPQQAGIKPRERKIAISIIKKYLKSEKHITRLVSEALIRKLEHA